MRQSLMLQPRDVDFLRGLFESRVMTATHICALYFGGKRDAAKNRIRKLVDAAFIASRPRQSFEPAVYFLARAGLSFLRSRGILQEYPHFEMPSLERRAQVSDLTLRHELEMMDIKASFTRALSKVGAAPRQFTTWPLLNRFAIESPAHGLNEVRPDAFIRLTAENSETHDRTFFLELDRSTEAQTTFIARANAYLTYYRSGGFALRCGGKRDDFRRYPFRVLLILKTAERRNNTAERLCTNNPPILTHAWLTTFAELVADPLGPIWIRPADFRAAIAGTEHDSRRPTSLRYTRNADRESSIERKIRKIPLLPPSSPDLEK